MKEIKGHPSNSCMGAFKDTLDVKLTDKCNGRCAFCIENKGLRTKKEATAPQMLASILEVNPKSVLLLGGEPGLYDDIEMLLYGLGEFGIEAFVTTNGTLLMKEQDFIRRIASHLKAVNLSMHSYSIKKNEEVTGVKLDLSRIERSISILRTAGVVVRVNSVLLDKYLDTFEECSTMIDFAESIGASNIRFSEIQNASDCPELYVDGAKVFSLEGIEPYTEGCERKLETKSAPATVKLACGLINPFRAKPGDFKNCGGGGGGGGCHGCHGRRLKSQGCHASGCQPATPNEGECHGGGCHGQGLGVLYPNAVLMDGWQKE